MSITGFNSVADFVTRKINLLDKTQKEIAAECGFDRPNVITMIKQGHTKVPLDKIYVIAKAINVDPAFFLRIVLNEYQPNVLKVIEECSGLVVTQNESEIIEIFRVYARDKELKLNGAQKESLKEWVSQNM